MKKFALFSFMFFLIFSACRKNLDEITTTETPHVPPIIEKWEQPMDIVIGSVTGFVADENGEPVADAAVSLGNLNTTTDAFGHFFFEDENINRLGTLVRVEKQGYFPGSRRFFAVANVENRVKIELITQSFNYSFDAASGGTVEMNGGAKVVFEQNSIQKADGSIYSGTVRVAANWLDPSDYRTLDRMPGNLQGVDNEANEVVLGTAGMMAVELQSESGEKLNILEGKTAEISMPVPPEFLSSAPAEIPNWSYNEEHGMWVEEGISKLQGSNYVGEVSHFSYWNHDFKDPLIEFKAIFTDENGVPLEDYKVVIRQPGTWLYGHGRTCEDGSIMGLIPQDYDLVLEVIGEVCNEVLYSQNIGPFPNNVDLGTIAVPDSDLNPTTIKGELVDCLGDPITNGMVYFEFGGKVVYEYTNGAPFDVLFSTCTNSTDISVTGVNLDDLLQSDPVTVAVGGTTDMGQISVCDQQLEEYIRLIVDGVTQIYTPVYVYDSMGTTTLTYWDTGSQNQIYMEFFGNTVGDYGGAANHNFFMQDNIQPWSFEGGFFNTLEITEYGAAGSGDPIIGNFSGTMENWAVNPSQTVNVSGDFSVKLQ